ncbi:MAG TPA: hypothetical protein VH540_23250 [Ktedonobacterales bacterium]|jgi:hypothetical protein
MADLSTKLGIKPGHRICLLSAPAESAALLKQSCQDASIEEMTESQRYDLIFFWPTELARLTETFADLQRQIVPSGAIWTIIPNKKHARARGLTFTWEDLQAAALQTDLVDNKIASLSEQEYGTRFVIRKDRRERGQ